MASFFQKAKNTALVAKIRGEIVLIDREDKQLQQAFGIELYDLLARLDHKHRQQGGKNMPLFLGTRSKEILHVYDEVNVHIQQFQDERDAKYAQIEHLQATRERARPVSTSKEKLIRAGNWISSNGQEASLQAENILVERKIKAKKEDFGLKVVSLLEVASSGGEKKKGGLGGIKDGITNQISKLSGSEKKIRDCIDRAVKTQQQIRNRKDRKLREIDMLMNDS